MKTCEPFLKWPGGKRWIIPFIENIINPKTINNYYEPFVGGGAVFFSFNFENAILSDYNFDLINTYKIVKEQPEKLILELQQFSQDKENYYKIRSTNFQNELMKAAQFLYLNRLAFGGMYRVNLEGKFNVPYGGGRKIDILWEKKLIENASNKLKNVKLVHSDFEEVFKSADYNDLVYCDPPYSTAHNLNGFQRYNENIFSWDDQERLSKVCFEAAKKGVKIIVSSAAHQTIRSIYSPLKPKVLQRYSGLSKNIYVRGNINEYVFLFNI